MNKVKYGKIVVEIYDGVNGEKQVNIANDAENITLSVPEARRLMVVLLGMAKDLLDE